MKKYFLFILILSISKSSLSQADSARRNDLRSLSDIIIKSISIPDSILQKPEGETIIFEISLKDKQITAVDIWHKQTRFLYDAGRQIAIKIKDCWKPQSDLPPTIYFPLCINFMGDSVYVDKNKDFWFEVLKNLKEIETKNFIVVSPPVIFYNRKPYRKKYN